MASNLSLKINFAAIDKLTGPLKKITQGSGKTAEALRASREQLKTLERAQRDLRGFRDLKRQAEDSNQALKAQQDEIRDLSRAMQNAEGDTSELTRRRDEAIRQARRLSHLYENEQRQLQQLRNGMTQVEGVTGTFSDQQRELQRRIQQANQELQQQQQELSEVARKQRQAAQAAQQFHRGMGRASRMMGAGAGGLATGGAALYAGARMLTPGVDYGAAMSRVQALTRLDKEDPRFRMLQDQARELGSTTSFSATQAADAQGFLAMAGFDPEAIQSAMPSMLDLAKAQGADLGRTADISSNLLSGFGLDPSEMTRLGDVITATTTRANVDLEMLGESMKYVAPVAREMGLSLEESAAMAGLLGNVGIQGSQAGTTLRAMMLRLSAPTGAAAGAIEALGINIKDTEGNMRNVPQILADVAKATKDLGNTERMEYLKKIFGEEPAAGMAELLNQQGAAGIERFVEILESAAGENARVAKVMADNIKGDLQGLNSAWEEVGITLTDTNKGPLRDLIQSVTEVTRAIGQWMKENPELTAQIATAAAGVAGLVAAGGALTLALGSLLGPMVLTRYGLSMLGIKGAGVGKLFGKIGNAAKWLGKTALPLLGKALTVVGRAILFIGRALLLNPIGLLITAIAGGAYLIWKHWDKLGPWFADLWERIKSAGRAVWEWIKDKGAQAADFLSYVFFNWTLPGLLIQHWDAIKATAGELWEWFKSIPGKAATFVANAFMSWTLPGLLITHWDEIKAKAGELWQWFQDAPGNAIDAIAQMIEDWSLKDILKEKWDAAINYLKSLPSQMREAGSNLAQGVADGISSGASSAWDAVRGFATQTTRIPEDEWGIHSPSRVFRDMGGHLMDGLALGIQREQDTPLGQLTAFSQRMRQAGAGLAIGAATLPSVATANIPMDHRPPLSAQATGGVVIEGGIQINVQPAPGMDEQALARYVASAVQRALDDAQRNASVRRRSAFHDTD